MTALLPIDDGVRRAIAQAVDSLRADNEALVARLVRHKSVLGHEQSCLADMAVLYGELGLEPRRVAIDVDALGEHPGFSPPLIPYAGREPVVGSCARAR